MEGVNNKIVNYQCINGEMEHKDSFKRKQEVMQQQPIQIRRGIFQRGRGGGLSPLLLCITHIPLTNELNRADCGYQVHGTERKISHLLCMDDLKLLGRKENDLKNEKKLCKQIVKI